MEVHPGIHSPAQAPSSPNRARLAVLSVARPLRASKSLAISQDLDFARSDCKAAKTTAADKAEDEDIDEESANRTKQLAVGTFACPEIAQLGPIGSISNT